MQIFFFNEEPFCCTGRAKSNRGKRVEPVEEAPLNEGHLAAKSQDDGHLAAKPAGNGHLAANSEKDGDLAVNAVGVYVEPGVANEEHENGSNGRTDQEGEVTMTKNS